MQLGIIVPCYNEEVRWDYSYWDELISIPNIFWMFVNDGSSDSTETIIRNLSDHANVDFITRIDNLGKGETVRQGILHFSTQKKTIDCVGFIDADTSISIADVRRLPMLWQELKLSNVSLDAIWGSRLEISGRDIDRKSSRHYLGRVLSFVFQFGQRKMPFDTQCGLKIFFLDEQLLEVLSTPFKTRWLFELEIISRWNAKCVYPIRIWEEPVISWKEITGSKITKMELLRILREVLKLKILQVQNSFRRNNYNG